MKKYENIDVINAKWVEADTLPKVIFDTEEDFVGYIKSENIPCVFHFVLNGGEEIADYKDIESKIRKLEDFHYFDAKLYKDICRPEIEEARRLREKVISGITKTSKEQKDREPISVYYCIKANLCGVFYENYETFDEDDIDETIKSLKYEYDRDISDLIKKMEEKLNNHYKNNKKQIKQQIEKIVINDDFMKLSNKTVRQSWFKENVDDEVLLQYPLLVDMLNLIYFEHKDEFKRR